MTGRRAATPILDGRLLCVQPEAGFRFAVDSLLLAHFVLTGRPRKRGSFCELGAGCGVVSAILGRAGFTKGLAVELQQGLYDCLVETLAASRLLERVSTLREDLRDLPRSWDPGACSVVVANPPFFREGEGRRSHLPEEAAARHELTCTMADVLSVSRYLLPPRGRLHLIYPASRLPECLSLLPTHKFCAVRLRMVHPRIHRPASHFLLEAAKVEGPALTVESPLVIHQGEGQEYGGWYGELLGHVEE
jgi:tRNA1Val (adenine37-N6)-methyltransferase